MMFGCTEIQMHRDHMGFTLEVKEKKGCISSDAYFRVEDEQLRMPPSAERHPSAKKRREAFASGQLFIAYESDHFF